MILGIAKRLDRDVAEKALIFGRTIEVVAARQVPQDRVALRELQLAVAKQRELAERQMPNGFGGMMSFVVTGGRDGAVQVINGFDLIPTIPSFGTSRTIATHPATHTHSNMKSEEREAVGIFDGLIRLSVGLEDPKDIIADLDQALESL